MAVNSDNWVQMFDIPDTSKHKKGFTLYKIISIVYPKNCPDAVTKLTVWKRYNDIKKLHKEMKFRHQSLYLKDKFPALPKTSYFKRFDDDVVEQRKQGILMLLDFISQQPQLFKSNEFVKFFETSHTPQELLSSSINSIRAELNLPMDAEFSSGLSVNSDDDVSTFSDTDSISTLSSISPSVQGVDLTNDPLYKSTASLTKLSRKVSLESASKTLSNDSHDSLLNFSISTLSPSESCALPEGQLIFPTPPSTPDGLSLNLTSSYSTPVIQYIIESEKYIVLAGDYESKCKYEEAFSAYKQAISILLAGVKADKDVNRRQMVRFKTEKCLLRAEKIYNIHLSTDLSIIRDLCASTKMQKNIPSIHNVVLSKPLSELHKYKVLKIVASGMLVLHSELQQLHFIKVIQTSSNYEKTKFKTILPKNVPYMIKLHTYYEYEDSIFLILQYSSGIKLNEHIKERFCSGDGAGDPCMNFGNETPEDFKNGKGDGGGDCMDPDSDCSYSDLINDYVSKDSVFHALKAPPKSMTKSSSDRDLDSSVEGGWDMCGSVASSEGSVESHSTLQNANLKDDPADNLETNHLLLQSQELLSSVESALLETKEKKNDKGLESRKKTLGSRDSDLLKKSTNKEESIRVTKQRKFSDKSLSAEFEYLPTVVVPHKAVVKWASQLLIAMERLHELGVICGYLSLNHLLIDDNEDLILTYKSNVNINRVFFEKSDIILAPDLYLCNEPTIASDWWCYGAILYELLTGMGLNCGHPEGISSFTLLRIPRYVSAEGKSLLKQLLTFEPHDRLGCGINGTEDLKSHPFFHSVDWNKFYTEPRCQ